MATGILGVVGLFAVALLMVNAYTGGAARRCRC